MNDSLHATGNGGTLTPPELLFGEVRFEPVRKRVAIKVDCAFLSVEQAREAEGMIRQALQLLAKAGTVEHALEDAAVAKRPRTRKPAGAATPRTRVTLGKVEKAVISVLGSGALGMTVDELIKSLSSSPAPSVRSAAKSLVEKTHAVLVDGRLWLPDRVPAVEPVPPEHVAAE